MFKPKYVLCRKVGDLIVDDTYESEVVKANKLLSDIFNKEIKTSKEAAKLVFVFEILLKEDYWSGTSAELEISSLSEEQKKTYLFCLLIEDFLDLDFDTVYFSLPWWVLLLDVASEFYDEYVDFKHSPIGPNRADLLEAYGKIKSCTRYLSSLFDTVVLPSIQYLKRIKYLSEMEKTK